MRAPARDAPALSESARVRRPHRARASSRATAVLYVFMPPLDRRSRTTSTWSPPSRRRPPSCGLPVVLEGYRRRATRACKLLQVTPDPGVIEVNIHPARELGRAGRAHRRSSTRRRTRRGLSTEKFMLDGRHTGTGGGNHFVLGGADAGRQPVPAPARPAAQPARATGTTIRRCRTCSRACSSARPARRRASTRRATTRSTSWRSRSRELARSRRRARPCRRGWSTGCSATC